MSEMQTKLQELLKGFLDEGQEMIDPTTPIATLGLESIRIMEFMLDVEDHYDISVDLESLGNIHTLVDLEHVIQRELG